VSDMSDVADRQELRALVERYGQNADRRDRTAFGLLFTSDAVVTFPSGGEVRGREAIGDILQLIDNTYTRTMHFVGNHLVDFLEDGAVGESYCIAHHIYSADEVERDTVLFIRYQDTYARTAKGWRIARRELVIDWQEDRPTTV
jgi:uncharacterized protein (TIGR02246 family)